MSFILIMCTAGNIENAELIADTIVKEKLAACVNIVPQITSIYSWKKQVITDKEVILLIKTKSGLFDNVVERIRSLHTYEVPEITSFKIENGFDKYIDWINKETI